jgi:hypothetical protein
MVFNLALGTGLTFTLYNFSKEILLVEQKTANQSSAVSVINDMWTRRLILPVASACYEIRDLVICFLTTLYNNSPAKSTL